MQDFNGMFNLLWCWMNHCEAEFEYFCKINDLNAEHPMSLQMFKNEFLAVGGAK